MASADQVQALLRFLTKECKISLAIAMSKVKDLQKANLKNPEEISKADLIALHAIFKDEKITKQVLNAAKRTIKKRGMSDGSLASPDRVKRQKKGYTDSDAQLSPYQFECSLSLPSCDQVEEISKTILVTNRAPLVLAFAVVVIKYTMPEQPLSSRLSLAQAVVSANSRTKAKSLGIEPGISAEDEGWGQGQPTSKLLGREIMVLKRWGYDWKEGRTQDDADHLKDKTTNVKETSGGDEERENSETLPALWGLDLEALRKSNGPVVAGAHHGGNTTLPIYRPESARDYLLKSFHLFEEEPEGSPKKAAGKGKAAATAAANRERSLGLLLGAIDLLCQSWSSSISKPELDRRAWTWYVRVRPDVQDGVAGWGQKGKVHLQEILDLRKYL